MESISIAPSILSADFTRLAEAVRTVEEAGADLIHVDVMDGHFVPNLTVGPPVVAALKRVTRLPLDVHLMIDNVDQCIEWYLDAGADLVTVHVEASTHLNRTLARIREAGARPAVTLNPSTPVHSVRDVLGDVDMVLVMSVNPGFSGQSFIPSSVRRIGELKALVEREAPHVTIQVDGGITTETIGACVRAGARCFVAGNAVFAQPDPKAALAGLRSAAETALGAAAV